jgi:prepilin-type processing-associated H-X9-DG protein
MNHRTWVIDLVLMFRLATANADEQQGPITLVFCQRNNLVFADGHLADSQGANDEHIGIDT